MFRYVKTKDDHHLSCTQCWYIDKFSKNTIWRSSQNLNLMIESVNLSVNWVGIDEIEMKSVGVKEFWWKYIENWQFYLNDMKMMYIMLKILQNNSQSMLSKPNFKWLNSINSFFNETITESWAIKFLYFYYMFAQKVR